MISCAFIAAGARADPALSLRRLPVTGPGITVALSMSGLGAARVSGYQAHLEFDPTIVSLTSTEYAASPMGLAIINPIAVEANQITLAAGINQFIGQQPTGADADLAYLHFASLNSGCQVRVRFRADAFPPTRMSDAQGNPLGSLETIDLWNTCWPDFNTNGHVEVQDIFDFLNAWFAGDCRADFNEDGNLRVQDIFDFLNAWFAGCP